MEHTIRMIPVAELEVSRDNARRQKAGEAADEELVASVAAHGVLNNLVVQPLRREKKNGVKYGVIAGGRRLRAVLKLIKKGTLPKDHEVPCAVRSDESPTEISLHENVVRMQMHAVDQHDAYRRMVDKGLTPDDIAQRLGTTAKQVTRYLRLANVHEDILTAARNDEVSQEVLMAFAATSDKERQLQVWLDTRKNYGGSISPEWVRREVLSSHVPAGHGRARFVGLAEYEAAGGITDRDLFTPAEEVYLTDVKLLDQLAMDKLQVHKAAIENDWGWVDTTLTADYMEMQQFGRIEGRLGELTEEETTRVAGIDEEVRQKEERAAQIEERLEAEQDLPEEVGLALSEELSELYNEADVLRRNRSHYMRRAREQHAVYDPGQMKHAGVVLTVDSDGELYTYAGLVKPEDAKKIPQPQAHGPEAAETGGETEQEPVPLGQTSTPGYRPPALPRAPQNPEQEAKTAAGLTQALHEQLQIVRMNLVKASLTQSFETAFDLLTFQLARRVLSRLGFGEHSLSITASETATHTPAASSATGGRSVYASSEEVLEEQARNLPLQWMELDDRLAQFRAFSELPEEDKQRIFSASVARTLEPQLAFEPKADRRPEVECAVDRLEVPLAAGYRPDAEHFWERVKKGDALATARAVLGPDWAEAHQGDRRPELAAALAAIFTAAKRPVGISEAQWEAVQAWTPPGFTAFDHQGLDPDRKVGNGPAARPYDDDDDGAGEDDNGTEPDNPEVTGEPETQAGFDPTPASEAPAFLNE